MTTRRIEAPIGEIEDSWRRLGARASRPHPALRRILSSGRRPQEWWYGNATVTDAPDYAPWVLGTGGG